MNKRNSTFADFDRKQNISCGAYLSGSDELLYADSHWDPETGKRVDEIILLDRRSGRKTRITAGALERAVPSCPRMKGRSPLCPRSRGRKAAMSMTGTAAGFAGDPYAVSA